MEPVSADIKYYEKSRQGHVSYVVEVGFRGAMWHLQRRFNDFAALHQDLRRHFPAAHIPDLPPKRFFGRFDPQFLNERSAHLHQFLQEVLATVPVVESQALVDFLEVPGNVAWERPMGAGGVGEFDRSGKEAVEQERLVALVEETAKALIDVSRTGVEPLEESEVMARREKLLRACDGFRAHAAHLRGFFKPHLPCPSDSVAGAGVDGLLEALSRPPSVPAEEQRAVMERCSLLVMDYLREAGKVKPAGAEDGILCFMQGGAKGTESG
ncbi:Phox homologous domain-containing protein [Tribonema minus]|uniref:Phox homologous domain-containing protein n=1 Tax=Tribonema minus TaxID=303371 RepID=A0A835Z1P2_9STRA|nr:Phox homologous domain-containing protein [Tribonema minus]